jgi:hypothetical protein
MRRLMDALTKWSAPVATKVKPRLTFNRLALLALACIAALSGSGYGYYWWTTGRFIVEQFITYFNATMARPFRWTYAGKPLAE